MEEWKEILGYEGMYQASTKGRIRSMDREDSIGRKIKGKEIKSYLNKRGYKIVRLSIKGRKKEERVHRLVLLAFNPIEGCKHLQVNHKDANKENNNLDNLEWATAQENLTHAKNNDLMPTGENHPNAVLSKNEVQHIFKRAWDGEPLKALADEFNCDKMTVRSIQMRKSRTKDTKDLHHAEEKAFLERRAFYEQKEEEYDKKFS